MKYLLTIICTVLICFYSTAQNLFEVTVGSGIGSYKMNDLKELQENLRFYIGGPEILETVDNFPAYFFYSGEVSVNVNRVLSLGLIYRLQSTGAASSYSDYSGVYKIEQVVKANCAGILLDVHLLKKHKLRLSSQLRTYYGWTNMKLKGSLHINSVGTNIMDFTTVYKSKSVMINPDIIVGYEVIPHVSLNFSAGYCLDFKGDLKNSNDSALRDLNGVTMQSDWSGIRLGLSASYQF